jgi:predicted hydrolase (HD superfamily)
MRAVELVMRHLAPRYSGDPEWWGVVGLLHDFDYERFPNATQSADQEHPSEGVRYLRAHDFPADGCDAILGHAEFTHTPRTSDLARVLFAVDELAGFVVACGLVRPSKSLADLEPPSVLKKLKDKGFARGVNRDDVRTGAGELGVPLDGLISDVLTALRPHERELGLGAA